MPAFTYVASLIVAEIFWTAGLYALGATGVAFVTSAIAFGLAYGTARLLGLSGGAGGTAQDPGVRIQFPPGTQNKVPIVYGSAHTKGTIVDARLSNQNKTMTYVLVLSEKTATGTFTIGDVYWNDQKLVFRTATNEEHIVASSIDQNGQGESNTNYDGLIRIRVYAGSTASADQIFPTVNKVNAQIPALDPPDARDNDYQLEELVFAVVEIDYNGEKGITGLGQITFQVNNTLKNPGSVWYDYITNNRYGAGITATQVSTVTSISTANTLSLYSWSNTVPPTQYVPWPSSTSTTTTATIQPRYEINGVLSTGDTVKTNIEKITQGCNCWTTFDYSAGQWKVIVNRSATGDELASAFEFTDDNIIGEVGISATNLEDLYNLLEVEFANRSIRDQNDYFRAAIDPVERNDLEPDNTLNLRLDLVNNAIHAARVGLIELKQSRVDLIITFRADYSAIQCEAGDVVKITNSVYGFDKKLFRISRLREVEGEDGSLTVEITALEYNADIYDDEALYDTATPAGSGIPTFGGNLSLPAPSAPFWDLTTTTTSTFNVDIFPNASTPYFEIHTTISAGSLPVDSVDFFYSTNSTTGFASLVTIQGPFNSGDDVETTPITGLAAANYYFKSRTTVGNRHSDTSTVSIALGWNPAPGGSGGFDGGLIT